MNFVGMTNIVLMQMRLILLILSFLTGLCFCSLAQNLTKLSASQQGNEVVVNYHLDGEKGKAYTVALYASHNNFASPLKMVQGDVNEKRLLVGNHAIRWNATDELKNFDADISFEIRAVPAPPLFKNIESSSPKVKRGKEVTISWSALHANESVKVELVRGENIIPIGASSNGKLAYTVPKKMKTGDYRIALSSGVETVKGGSLVVKPKFPLLVKVLPVAAAGVVIFILSQKDKPAPGPETKLIGPPVLTGN